MYYEQDGVSTFRKVAEEDRLTRFRCGVATSFGVFLGGDRDVMRLRQIIYVPPVSFGTIPDDNVTWWGTWTYNGDTPDWNMPAKDFGEGWNAAPTIWQQMRQNYGSCEYAAFPTEGPGSVGWNGFMIHYHMPYPLLTGDAVHMLDGDQLIPCGPPDAIMVTDLIEHGGELWASGWGAGEPFQLNSAATGEGFADSDEPTTPTADPPNPFVPTRGDAGFRMYDFETETWVPVPSPQQTCNLRPRVWRRSSDGTWTAIEYGVWDGVRVASFLGNLARPFRLTSTTYGVFVQMEGYIRDYHPVLTNAGQPQFLSHPTFLIDAAGYCRYVGYVAAIADTGGGVIAIGPSRSWRGPQVTFVRSANGPLTDPNGRLQPIGSEAAMTPFPMLPPVHWRGRFYSVWEMLTPGSQQFAIAEIHPGASTVLWSRCDGVRWTRSLFAAYNRLAVTPAEMVFVRGLDLDRIPNGYESDADTREFVATMNTLLAQSATWDHRSAAVFASLDEGCFSVGISRLLYPYTEPQFTIARFAVRDIFKLGFDQRIRTHHWEVMQRPARVTVARVDLEWLWVPEYSEGPQVESLQLEWLWDPQYSEGPQVESLQLEWSNGSAAEVPEVASAAADWSNGVAADVPDVGSVEAGWAAHIVEPVDHPNVLSTEAQWSNGAGAAEPDVESAETGWAAHIEEPTETVEVDSAQAQWSDGTAVAEPETYTVRLEWAKAGAGPDGEKYLVVAVVDHALTCYSVRVQAVGISEAEARQCRVLYRADREGLSTTLWSSYEVGELDADLPLTVPGHAVRVVVIGPTALPDDTDFLVDFERS